MYNFIVTKNRLKTNGKTGESQIDEESGLFGKSQVIGGGLNEVITTEEDVLGEDGKPTGEKRTKTTAGKKLPRASIINSAANFLWEIGEKNRYYLLEKVKAILAGILSNREYVIREIGGLGNINDNYTKRGIESKITLQLAEDLQWATWYIIHALHYIIYDTDRQIEILPRNLQRFTCLFWITDIRDLSCYDGNGLMPWWSESGNYSVNSQKNRKKTSKTFTTSIDSDTQSVMVEIPACYFDLSGLLPESINNTDPQELSHVMTLSTRCFRVSSVFASVDESLLQYPTATIQAAEASMKGEGASEEGGSFWNKVWKGAKEKAIQYAAATAAAYTDAIVSKAKEFAMNKVYELVEESGIKNIANKALSVIKNPSMTVDNMINAIEKKLGEGKEETSYFTDPRQSDYLNMPEYEQYRKGGFNQHESNVDSAYEQYHDKGFKQDNNG